MKNKHAFFICLYISLFLVSNVISGLNPVKIQLTNTGFSGIFLRKINENEFIFGNQYADIRYSLISNSITKTYKHNSICAYGTVCPLLMYDNNGVPNYMVSKQGGTVKVVKLSDETVSTSIDEGKDVKGMTQYDEKTMFVLTSHKTLAAAKRILKINAETKKLVDDVQRTYTTDAGLTKLSNGQLLMLTYYSLSNKSYANFYNVNLDLSNEPKMGINFDDSYGDYHIIEISDQRLIVCFLNDNRNAVICLSGKYSTDNFETKYGKTTVISGCSDNNQKAFSMYKYSTDKVLIGCGGSPFYMQIFEYNLAAYGPKLQISGYQYVEFTVLSDYKLLFGMVQHNGNAYEYYHAVYYFPVCVDLTIYTISTVEFSLKNIFNYDVTGNTYTQYTNAIQIETLPQNGAVIKSSGQPVMQYQRYYISTVSYLSNSSVKETIKYKGVEFDTFGGSFESNLCTLTVISCYHSCSSCSVTGNYDAHNCNTCDTARGYYLIEDGSSSYNCIQKGQKPNNYYFDETSQRFKPCYNTCGSCTYGGNIRMNNCTTCLDSSYAFIETQPTNCILKSEKPNGFYLGKNDFGEEMYYQCKTANCKECDGVRNNNHPDECFECLNGYYFFIDRKGECVYYYDIPANTYYNDEEGMYLYCYNRCARCFDGGNNTNHQCTLCIDGLSFITAEPTNCISQEEKELSYGNYYLDTETNTYRECHSNCSRCSKGASDVDNNCEQCREGYAFMESDPQYNNCYNLDDKPSNYYYDVNSNTMRKCYASCGSCIEGGDDSNQHCTSCNVDYYFFEYSENCITKGSEPSNYYLDIEQGRYLPCYERCASCSYGGDVNNNNCSTCNDNMFFIENDTSLNCYYPSEIPSNYYYDDATNIYKKCFKNCNSCYGHGSSSHHNCSSCINDHYFITTHEHQCIHISQKPTNFYIDNDTMKECYQSCETCTTGFDVVTHMQNCDTCITSYFKIANTSNCTKDEDIPEGYYKGENGTALPCYNTCYSCSRGANATHHNCDKCKTNYSWTVDAVTNCISASEKKINYYLNVTTNTYMPCYNKCNRCKIGGNADEHNCDKCIDNWYFIENDITEGNCYNVKPADNYYIDHSLQMYRKCFNRCGTCDYGGKIGEHNCTSCVNGLYSVERNESACITANEKEDKYYFDNEHNMFKLCYDSCGSCDKGGDDVVHNCNTCASDSYAFIETLLTRNNCLLINEIPTNYYFNNEEHIYKQCYETCNKCIYGGMYMKHNCSECINEYSFLMDEPTNCISQGTNPYNYYLDTTTNTYRPCYFTCEVCSQGAIDGQHKCDACTEGLEYTSGDNKGNCLDLNFVDNSLNEISQFLPLNTSFNVYYDVKIIQIGKHDVITRNSNNADMDMNNTYSTFNYYTTRTIFNDITRGTYRNISHVELGQCETVLKGSHSIISSDYLFIAQMLLYNDIKQLSFNVYDSKGNLLDISKCYRYDIAITYPMQRQLTYDDGNTTTSSLLDKLLSLNNSVRYDIYNPKSDFYNNICDDLTIEGNTVTLQQRQEMYNHNLTLCPLKCNFVSFDIELRIVNCNCKMEYVLNGKIIEDSETVVFNINDIKDDSVYLFKCGYLIKEFTRSISKTFLHWIIVLEVCVCLIATVMFGIKTSRIKNNITSVLTVRNPASPPKKTGKVKLNSKEFKTNTNTTAHTEFIEMRPMSSNTNNNNSNNDNDEHNAINDTDDNVDTDMTNELIINDNEQLRSSNARTTSLFANDPQVQTIMNEFKKHSIEELNLMTLLDIRRNDTRSLKEYFIHLLKQKLFLYSITKYQNLFVITVIKLHIHLFTLVSLIFYNSILYSKPSNAFSFRKFMATTTRSAFYGYLTLKLLEIIVSCYCELSDLSRSKHLSNKQIRKKVALYMKNIKYKNVSVLVFTFIMNVMFWYYVFIFGTIHNVKQVHVSMMTVLGVLFVVMLQVMIGGVVFGLRVLALKLKSNLIHMLCRCLYYVV